MAGIALGLLAIGAAAGTCGSRLEARWQPQPVMLLQVTPIDKMQDNAAVAVKGRVTEIFGNKFIVDDGSSHALVDLGPRGEDASAVSKDEMITVQGRFDRGVLHAELLEHSDGRTDAFGPPRGPIADRRGHASAMQVRRRLPATQLPRLPLDVGPPPPPPGPAAPPPAAQ